MAQPPKTHPVRTLEGVHGIRPLPSAKTPLGIPVEDADPSQATAFYQELTNKLAWAIGSTYKRTYHSKKGPVRDFAWELTKRIVGYQGLPDHHLKQ